MSNLILLFKHTSRSSVIFYRWSVLLSYPYMRLYFKIIFLISSFIVSKMCLHIFHDILVLANFYILFQYLWSFHTLLWNTLIIVIFSLFIRLHIFLFAMSCWLSFKMIYLYMWFTMILKANIFSVDVICENPCVLVSECVVIRLLWISLFLSLWLYTGQVSFKVDSYFQSHHCRETYSGILWNPMIMIYYRLLLCYLFTAQDRQPICLLPPGTGDNVFSCFLYLQQ